MSRKKKIYKKDIDEEIVKAISKGEYAALSQIYALYFPAISSFVVQNNGSEEEAKDVFQEAVVLLYDKIKQEDFILKSKLQTYLYAVSRNIWLKQLRDKNTNYNTTDISDYENELAEEGKDEDLERRQLEFEKMESALEKLGNPCKEILTKFYIKEKSMQEISEQMGYTNANNVKTQKYKCLQRLKKYFFESLLEHEI